MIIAKKSLGQNFLIDKNIANKIINTIEITNNNIIEVGPGLGALTEKILEKKPNKLIIIEKDIELYQKLLTKFDKTKIKIINDDALFFDFSKLKRFKLISNLPYNISSKFLLKIIKQNNNFTDLVCMIQSELADKLDYKKGKMNKYKFISEYCGIYKKLFNVSPNVFYPKPKVNSKVVKFKLIKQDINSKNLDYFLNIFFKNKRKKIKSNKNIKFFINGNVANKRYEDLTYTEILDIYKKFNFSFS
ncbi:16S rRNA (adenine(1518)-N(6)/adenine(1519)-N(6))-dimethyltransferase RsmA [Pelagibacteraceae bacterium]|nr:16S rRNA (adenine(1518)-N(6)/adenine(1519)-N(6))-dimethyltransferase RsmA [Pelagibacteraceae bacterium]